MKINKTNDWINFIICSYFFNIFQSLSYLLILVGREISMIEVKSSDSGVDKSTM
jgi:hypothetical protein